MKILKVIALSGILVSAQNCTKEGIDNIINQGKLSDEEIAKGLKEALRVGTDTSSAQLSATNGYFKDLAVKILLPTDLRNSIQKFKNQSITISGGITVTGQQLYTGYPQLGINGLKNKEDELIKGINRAAEDAAGTVVPIFGAAISGITIRDANNILFGGVDTAATAYLRTNTETALFNNYEPKIENALNSITIGNANVTQTYESFVRDYNQILNTSVPGSGSIGDLMNIQTVNTTDLSAYATNEGLDGLFLKISEEEADIRKNPAARVNDLLEKVFGELDS